jgi:L-rhamnose mutarotase
MRRVGQVIRLKPEQYEAYKRLHSAVWPEVLATIDKANIRNYSIFHWNGLLFSYFEYVGDDFDADMANIATDPKTREWWQLTDPMQTPVEGNSSGSIEGDWWTPIEEVFHTD